MCFQIIGLIAGILGSFIQASAVSAQAQAQADYQNYQIELQNRQLKEEKDLAFIESANTEIQRRDASRRAWANNQAVMAGYTFGGESRSAEALDKYNERQLKTDVSLIRLENTYTNARIADQIALNNTTGMYARWNANVASKAAFGTAFVKSVGDIAAFGASQSRYGALA